MEQEIHIPAKTWTDVYELAVFKRATAFRIYNDDDCVVRVSTDNVRPTRRDAGIPTYVKQFTTIPVNVGAWVYCTQPTALILTWESNYVYPEKGGVSNLDILILSNKIDNLITIQEGMLSLLEAAFEDGISGRQCI